MRRPVPTVAAGWACMDGRLPAAAMSPPAQGLRPCPRWTAAVRPAPGCTLSRTAETAAVSGSAVTCWGSGPGRCSRPRSTVRRRGQRTRLVDTGSPQVPGAADTRDCGRVVRTVRQRHAGQPAAEPSTATPMSDQERDRKVRHRPAPPWPHRQTGALHRPGLAALLGHGPGRRPADAGRGGRPGRGGDLTRCSRPRATQRRGRASRHR
jgi:hypothetical protein